MHHFEDGQLIFGLLQFLDNLNVQRKYSGSESEIPGKVPDDPCVNVKFYIMVKDIWKKSTTHFIFCTHILLNIL